MAEFCILYFPCWKIVGLLWILLTRMTKVLERTSKMYLVKGKTCLAGIGTLTHSYIGKVYVATGRW